MLLHKIIFSLLIFCSVSLYGQKVVYIDMNYLFSQIPAYEAAQKELDQIAKEWEQELKVLKTELDQMYLDFETDKVLLSEELLERRRLLIKKKENQYNDLKQKYFGIGQEYEKKQKALLRPIQDDIFRVIEAETRENNYGLVLNKSEQGNIIFANPKYDITDQVLRRLGYK